jgi:hypothetical protein
MSMNEKCPAPVATRTSTGTRAPSTRSKTSACPGGVMGSFVPAHAHDRCAHRVQGTRSLNQVGVAKLAATKRSPWLVEGESRGQATRASDEGKRRGQATSDVSCELTGCCACLYYGLHVGCLRSEPPCDCCWRALGSGEPQQAARRVIVSRREHRGGSVVVWVPRGRRVDVGLTAAGRSAQRGPSRCMNSR